MRKILLWVVTAVLTLSFSGCAQLLLPFSASTSESTASVESVESSLSSDSISSEESSSSAEESTSSIEESSSSVEESSSSIEESSSSVEESSSSIEESSAEETKKEFALYDKEEYLRVKVVGNSFIGTSLCAEWFQKLCWETGANVEVLPFIAYGYGRIPDQIELAFGSGGYFYTEEIDVLFVQDFYDSSDSDAMAEFLELMNAHALETGASTEVKIFPAENESRHGGLAALRHDLQLVSWKRAILKMKENGFAYEHLNYPNDSIQHSNVLAGVCGGAMMYLSLYGDLEEQILADVIANAGLYQFMPGETDEEKRGYVKVMLDCCKEVMQEIADGYIY